MSDILKTGKILSETDEGTTIMLPVSRAAWASLVEPNEKYGKHSITLIFDTDQKNQYGVDLDAVLIPALDKIVKRNKFKGGKRPEGYCTGLHNGEEYMAIQESRPKDDGGYWSGHSSSTYTMVVATTPARDKLGNIRPISCVRAHDPKTLMTGPEILSEIYDGCYVRVIINAKVTKNAVTGKPMTKVMTYLQRVQKVADGERFGEFSGAGFDDLPPAEPDTSDLSQF